MRMKAFGTKEAILLESDNLASTKWLAVSFADARRSSSEPLARSTVQNA
jgi:hypothetical protein